MKKGVIFDLDGVIVDTAPFHYLAWKETADKLGIQIDEEFNESLKGIDRYNSLQKILDFGNVVLEEDEKERLMTEKNNRYLELLESLSKESILPGIEIFISDLKNNGYKLALASASKNAPLILKKTGLYEYFDNIAEPGSVRAKPYPDIFLKGAELLGLNADECVGIEDSYAGIQAINDAGIYSVGIGNAEILSAADMNLKSTDFLTLELINSIV